MTDRTVLLGFEIGTGERVEIPVLNLAVTGQTQRSGKTTTLEALVSRSGVRALTFITKRGEGAFTAGKRVDPYFRERADWQFVSSILDATLQEKNKFLRSWIIKICRNTRSLADVQRAVRAALKDARGVNEGVYTQLDAYLDLIVPEIGKLRFPEALELGPGLNVMDLSGFSLPMQMLFIQSALDWINQYEINTVVVIPEAWEMVPEGKGSPVKASAESLVRKGSAIGNHIWLDSQDMAGVSKVLLRGCPVWLIGVQRESNEIKRNLSNIPASIKKPTPTAVATLEKGQFYACWGTHAVKTYVCPAWMPADEARDISLGAVPVTAAPPTRRKENTVKEEEAQRLRDENARLSQRVDELERFIQNPKSGDFVEITRHDDDPVLSSTRRAGTSAIVGAEGLSRAVAGHAADVRTALNGDSEVIYQFVKDRLSKEAPALLRVLTIVPELEIKVERKTLEVDGSTPKGRIARLFARGWFDEPKTQGGTRAELRRTGTDVNSGTVSTVFSGLLKDGFLTVESGDTYKAVPEMKVRIVEV